MNEAIEYPLCHPERNDPNTQCAGRLVPVTRQEMKPGPQVASYWTATVKIWKCTACGREVK